MLKEFRVITHVQCAVTLCRSSEETKAMVSLCCAVESAGCRDIKDSWKPLESSLGEKYISTDTESQPFSFLHESHTAEQALTITLTQWPILYTTSSISDSRFSIH